MRIYIDTLGCPKNITDSEYAAGILENAGHDIVLVPEDADTIIVNTCGFINDAKEESIDRIFELAEYKKHGAALIVSGCLSQRYNNELSKELPEVDAFLGVNDYHRLPQVLEELRKGQRQFAWNSCEKEFAEYQTRKNLGVSFTSYLKIAEGCDNVCAYCIIPSIRGPYRSRQIGNILKEAEFLAGKGCKELILVAQDVTAYGIDLYGDYKLPELLEQLCKFDSIRWIRLMYCYEDRITDSLISVIGDNDKICKYLDIPIQHISDKILRDMNRRSTKDSIIKTIKKLRSEIPDIHIRTTLITGFPGETDDDFNELYQFVKETRFERLGVFAYSKEEGTKAALSENQVKEPVKQYRRDQIMALQRSISLEHNQNKVGLVMEAIIEEEESPGCYIARTSYDAPDVDNTLILSSEIPLKPGDLVQTKITDAFDYDLSGCFLKKI